MKSYSISEAGDFVEVANTLEEARKVIDKDIAYMYETEGSELTYENYEVEISENILASELFKDS
jgi:hypothetical protein